MSWFQTTLTERNGKSYAKTVLLNTKKCGESYADSTSCVLYYNDYGKKTTKLKSSSTQDTVEALLENSTLYNTRVMLPIIGKSTVRTVELGTEDLFSSNTRGVTADDLVMAWDIDASTCYALFEQGFGTVLYKVDDVIANLESASSTSVSIA
jgi:hypothetical protein